MVVNLFYEDKSLLPVRGFGYLLPQSLPEDQNPEQALGVVFDSEAFQGQDTANGTKLTVMLGGHYWRDRTTFPGREESLRMAQATLKRHLNIHDSPSIAKAALQRSCIPQYPVGHWEGMQSLHRALAKTYGGKLKVAGSGYRGVAVVDCIHSAYEIARDIDLGENMTGLESFMPDDEYQMISE